MKTRDYLFRFPYSILIIIGVILLVYSQILTFSLGKLDEYNILIVNMDFLRDFSHLKEALLTNPFFNEGGEFYRPLQNLSFMIDAHLSGGSGWGFYLSNLIIHAVTCSLVWYLLTLLGSEKRIALLLSLLFAVHPLFVQTVAWAPSRGDMLVAMFGLLSFIMFLLYIRERKAWFLVVHILAYGLALFSKESAVFIPVLCYLYFFFFEREKKPAKAGLVIAGLCYILFIGLFFYLRNEVVHIAVPKSQIGVSVLLHNFRTFPEFIFKFFIPADLTPLPAFNWAFTILGLVFVLILGVVSVKSKPVSFRLFFFGLAWFFLFTVPALVYINKFGSASCDYMEHRAYFPVIGLIIFMALWLSKLAKSPSYSYLPVLLFLLLLVFGVYTGVYARTYKDGWSYFDRAVSKNPSSAIAWYCRGTILAVERSDYRAAISDLEQALKLYPDYAQAYLNRGFCREQLKDISGAASDYKTAALINPLTYEPHAALAFLYSTAGKKPEAVLEFDSAIELNPNFLEGFYRRALLKMEFNDYQSALGDLNKAIEIDGRYAEAYLSRGVIRFQMKEMESAMEDLDIAIRLDDSLVEAYINRGVLKFQVRDFQGALDDLDRAIQLNDKSIDALVNRGRILYLLGQQQDAYSDLEKAARLGSRDAEILLNNL